MARDLAPDVERLLESPNPYIRKKAALCTSRILMKVPDLIEQFSERAAELVHDKVGGRRGQPSPQPPPAAAACCWPAAAGPLAHWPPGPLQNHGVLLCGVTLMLDICAAEPSVVDKYRAHVPMLCKILRTLLSGGFSPEHDVGGINDPFLQVKILRLLRLLGECPQQHWPAGAVPCAAPRRTPAGAQRLLRPPRPLRPAPGAAGQACPAARRPSGSAAALLPPTQARAPRRPATR
jgi:hypothetical protein